MKHHAQALAATSTKHETQSPRCSPGEVHVSMGQEVGVALAVLQVLVDLDLQASWEVGAWRWGRLRV